MPPSIGFPPVARADARVLILGTLPGAESLRQRQYYAKKQNSFWRIMGEIVNAPPEMPYKKRLACLTKNGIALWDVCASAERKGSLDSNIKAERLNDFELFFKKHKKITLICFNGQPAAKKFRRFVWPQLSGRNFDFCILPSTSPAYAGMRYERKLARWRKALRKAVKANAKKI
ncbi:MAG: DNA-deoxyinosine glycosylase [Bdellovibrionales bacterium]